MKTLQTLALSSSSLALLLSCAAPPPSDRAALLNVYDVEHDAVVCGATAAGFNSFATRDCAAIIHDDAPRAFALENGGNAILDVFDVSVEGSGFDVVSFDRAVLAGEFGSVVVSFAGEDGDTGVVTVHSSAENDAVVTIALTGVAAPDPPPQPRARITPEACSFGRVSVGDTAFCDVSISNDGAVELVVSDVGITLFPLFGPEGNINVPFIVPAGTTVSLRLYARPDAVADFSGDFVLSTLEAARPELRIPLAVTGVR